RRSVLAKESPVPLCSGSVIRTNNIAGGLTAGLRRLVMFRRVSMVILLAALAVPMYAPAADKNDIKELQRDVALLQDMMKQLQASQDKRLADLQASVQQALDSANRANQAISGIQSSLQQSLRTQEEKVVTPVVGLSTRMDNL